MRNAELLVKEDETSKYELFRNMIMHIFSKLLSFY